MSSLQVTQEGAHHHALAMLQQLIGKLVITKSILISQLRGHSKYVPHQSEATLPAGEKRVKRVCVLKAQAIAVVEQKNIAQMHD